MIKHPHLYRVTKNLKRINFVGTTFGVKCLFANFAFSKHYFLIFLIYFLSCLLVGTIWTFEMSLMVYPKNGKNNRLLLNSYCIIEVNVVNVVHQPLYRSFSVCYKLSPKKNYFAPKNEKKLKTYDLGALCLSHRRLYSFASLR